MAGLFWILINSCMDFRFVCVGVYRESKATTIISGFSRETNEKKEKSGIALKDNCTRTETEG